MKNSSIYCFILTCLLGTPIFLLGQTDTLLTIETVEVLASSIKENSIGTLTQSWNNKELNQSAANNVAELLDIESGIFIKSYGAGSLATSSIRGGSAGHTAVLWNGMPIQSPMLGLLDLSLLPINAFEEISLQKGGNSALWGSGAVGGVITLNNRPDFNNKLGIDGRFDFGSYKQLQQQAKLSIGNHRFQSVTKVSKQTADNDFYYFVGPDLPKRKQSNAALSQQNIMQDVYWKPNQKYLVSSHFWRQSSHRDIPPTDSQTSSVAFQEDKTTRVLLQAKNIGNTYLLNAKIGFADEHLDYYNDATNFESLSRFVSWNAELGSEWQLSDRQKIYAGFTETFTRAWSAGYTNVPSEYNTAFLISYQLNLKKLQLQGSVRFGLVNKTRIPEVPVLAADYLFSRFLKLKLKVSKNYRLPTFNDRFWKPGGNEDLLPESGWSEEATLQYDFKRSKSQLSVSLTAFNRNINNWILWTPKPDVSYWAPGNIAKVWSRGLEPQVSFITDWSNLQVELTAGYNYIRSTYQVALTLPKVEKGDQLIYTPEHQAFAKLAIQYKRLKFAYRHHYNGGSHGVNQALLSYKMGTARIDYNLKKNKLDATIFMNANNIWNENYQVVERRPMPGRNYELGLRFLIKTDSK